MSKSLSRLSSSCRTGIARIPPPRQIMYHNIFPKTRTCSRGFEGLREVNCPSRSFSSTARGGQEKLPIAKDDVEEHLSSDRQPEEDTLPWYLQPQEYADLPAQPPSARQQLPDLPPDPPPLLAPILQHISLDMGLDDLSLIDLRALNPPSGLGPNLIMIIGTARGEKHLHVSADRFCRHLRAEHRLRPHADGLLGRGELKIRMRRRAKRIRVLAHAGAVDARMAEEELRTGWVCVIVDGLEPAAGWTSPVVRREGFVGFDDRTEKTTLVVQMMTEARRGEVELEELWRGRAMVVGDRPLPDGREVDAVLEREEEMMSPATAV